MEEEWRPAIDSEGYEVSSLGRVRSVDRVIEKRNGMTARYRGKILKPIECQSSRGVNPLVTLCFVDGTRKAVNLARAVCEAFHGPPPSDTHHAAHLDRNRRNNQKANLAWCTPTENASHRYGHGTILWGEKNPRAKITESDVAVIISRHRAGDRTSAIASDYAMSTANINRIANRKTWTQAKIWSAADG